MKLLHRLVIPVIVFALAGVPLLPRSQVESAARDVTLNRAIYTPGYVDWLEARGAHVSGTPVTSAQARQGSPGWTVMIYMAADNNLEPFGMADFNEMEFVGSTEGVNVVLQIDRADQYDTSDGDWTGTRRYFITRDTSLSKTGSEQVADLGETNTGDPATLADFITWSISTYPAQHYALILWDHGGSWLGVATDESAAKDSLLLPELEQALSQATQAVGIDKLDLIGFDACLMGSFEVYRTLASFARYGVASAELIPGNGWDYLGTLDALAADPSMQGDALGRAAIDSFMGFYTDVVTQYKIFNLALVDLSQAGSVVNAIQGVDAALTGAPDAALDAVITARSETPVYGAFDDPSFTDVWSAADMIGFMRLLADTASGTVLAGAAQGVFDAGSSMVLYYRSSTEPDVRGSSGMSIYFPRTANLFQLADRYQTEAPQLGLWQSFLSQFFQVAKSHAGTALEGAVSGISAQAQQALVQLSLGEGTPPTRAFSIVDLDLGHDQRIWVDYARLSPEGAQTATWSGQVAWLSDGYSATPVLVVPSLRDPDLGIVNGTLYPQNGAPVKAQAVFDLTTGRMTSLWGFLETASGLMPSEITGLPGDIFHPDWLSDGPQGSTTVTPANVQFVLSDQPLQLVWQRAPQGAYRVVLHVDDAAGEISRDSLDVAVTENSEDVFDLQAIDPESDDIDADGLFNEEDNCPAVANPDQEDYDADGVGDACDLFDDEDLDSDGVGEEFDNCPSVYNPDQEDENGDGVGDACAVYGDEDTDGIPDESDNCLDVYNPEQADVDGDGIGDECDDSTEEFDLDADYSWEEAASGEELTGEEDATSAADSDGDGVEDDLDNCADTTNPDQADADGNGIGDACDAAPAADGDGDGVEDDADNCFYAYNPDQADADGNGIGDACDAAPAADSDGDGVEDDADNCFYAYNPDQADADGNGIGDACDTPPDAGGSGDSGGGDEGEG